MRITCGTDIIEIDRVKDSIERQGERFINRIYTQTEIKYCESKGTQKYQHYAARFAVKEATFKAISEELKSKYDIDWKDIEIINDKQGKPHVAINKMDMTKVESVDVSISHCKTYAIANVTILYKE